MGIMAADEITVTAIGFGPDGEDFTTNWPFFDPANREGGPDADDVDDHHGHGHSHDHDHEEMSPAGLSTKDFQSSVEVSYAMGSLLLASSLVADLQLIAAAVVWGVVVHGMGETLDASVTSSIVSLSGGAVLANLVSVVLLIMETYVARR